MELEDTRVIMLDIKEALRISPEILKQQNIPFDMSANLRSQFL